MCGVGPGPWLTKMYTPQRDILSLAVSNSPMLTTILRTLAALILSASLAPAETNGHSVLLVVNDNSSVSRNIGDYYARRRSIPLTNICHISASEDETVPRDQYNLQIAAPIAACLQKSGLVETVLYIVTTLGVPLRIAGTGAMDGDQAAVDSELTLLYLDMKRRAPHPLKGSLPNPFFGRKAAGLGPPQFPF